MKFPLRIILFFLLAAQYAASAELPIKETTRIGLYDEDPNYMFGRIAEVAVLSDESVVVLDHQIKQLRKYSHSGEFLMQIGHEGEGPGEYWDARAITVLPGDRLVVLSRPSVVSIFDGATGEFVKSFTVPSGLFSDHLLDVDDSGNLYVKAVQDIPKPDGEWTFEWLCLNASGEVTGKVTIPQEKPSHEQFVIMGQVGPRWNFASTTEAAWSSRGYLVVGRNDRYAFEIRRPNGTVHVEREFEPPALTDGEAEEWRRIGERMGRRSNKSYVIPKTKPAFRSLHVDSQGRVWVNRYVTATEHTLTDADGDPYTTWLEPNSYDVFSETGQFLGTVALPPLIKAITFSRSAIWGVERTDRGERLIRWEIEGLDGGSEH